MLHELSQIVHNRLLQFINKESLGLVILGLAPKYQSIYPRFALNVSTRIMLKRFSVAQRW